MNERAVHTTWTSRVVSVSLNTTSVRVPSGFANAALTLNGAGTINGGVVTFNAGAGTIYVGPAGDPNGVAPPAGGPDRGSDTTKVTATMNNTIPRNGT